MRFLPPNTTTAQLTVAAVCMLAAESCHAAAPVYFDIGGLILFAALYILGLLALLAAVVFSKKRLTWLLCLVVYVAAPVVWFFIAGSLAKSRNAAVHEDVQQGEAKNRDAFASYCKDRRRVVHTRVEPALDDSLLIRVEPGFTGTHWQFNAFPVNEYLAKNPKICETTGLTRLEGIYEGRHVPEKRGYEQEVRLYKMCSAEKWRTATEPVSRYELVLGESAEKKPVPWGSEGGRWMSRSSIRVVDRQTGAILAEDWMYFLRYETGQGVCPDGMAQLASLLTDVFHARR